jgi:hypothetical protein
MGGSPMLHHSFLLSETHRFLPVSCQKQIGPVEGNFHSERGLESQAQCPEMSPENWLEITTACRILNRILHSWIQSTMG